jgi:AcrR family transcriptional regulator
MTSEPASARPRRRDPEAHRAAILEAAREVLAEQGYARATIREIARRAGVTHGLVMRHFGTKEQLMAAALPDPPGIEEVADGPLETLPERMAAMFVKRMTSPDGDDPLLAIIRSAATNERVGAVLYDEMRRRSSQVLARLLPQDALGVVGDLVIAVMIGVAFECQIVRTGELSRLPADELETHLAGLFRQITGPLLTP